MPHDRALQEAVLTELGSEPSINVGHIGFTAQDGVAGAMVGNFDDGAVTSTETISNLFDNETACRTAWKARWPISVQNDPVVA